MSITIKYQRPRRILYGFKITVDRRQLISKVSLKLSRVLL